MSGRDEIDWPAVMAADRELTRRFMDFFATQGPGGDPASAGEAHAAFADAFDSFRRTLAGAEDPVGLEEIAQRLGVKRATADQWRARGVLPEPTWPSVGGRPAWRWSVIQAWASETGRLAAS